MRHGSLLLMSICFVVSCGEHPPLRDPVPAHQAAAQEARQAFQEVDRHVLSPQRSPTAETTASTARPQSVSPTAPALSGRSAEAEATPQATTQAAIPTATAAATPARGRPGWADRLPQSPEKLYAVGAAQTGQREAARKKALAELATSLSARVQAETIVKEGEIARIGPGGQRVAAAWSEFRQQVRISTDRQLVFTQIVAEADDGETAWALAELDRAAWVGKLQQDLAAVDREIEAVAREQRRGGVAAAASALSALASLTARREALTADWSLAAPGQAAPACPVNIREVILACARVLGSVSIRVEGAPDAVFAARIQEALIAQHLQVKERDASVTLRLALRETPRQLPNGWHSVTVAGSATIVDSATGAIAGSLQISEKGTDVDPANARAKMLTKAAEAIASEIDRRLIALLANAGR